MTDVAELRGLATENLPDVLGAVERWVRGDEAVWRHARCIEEWGPDFEMYRTRWSRGDYGPQPSLAFLPPCTLARTTAMVELRQQFLQRFGFMLPCAELLDELQKSKLVVEIGAGTGYMTRILRNRGINVIGSDPQLSYRHVLNHALYDDRQVIAQGKTMVRRYPDATIFCSWPSLDDTWYRQALKAMRVGQRIVAVLEDSCAEETAREYFDACFDTERLINIPAFEYMNDIAHVAVKKRNRSHDV
jgi:hypothetical protein